MIKYFPALLLLSALVACNGNHADQPAGIPADSTATHQPAVSDTIVVAYPADTLLTAAMIFNESGYHSDEISPEIAGKLCFGLFRNPKGYYIDSTRVTADSVYDAVVDEDTTQHTGITIQAIHADTALFLFSGISSLQAGPVEPFPLLTQHHESHEYRAVLPGDTIHITYSGNSYIIFATGSIQPKESLPQETSIVNYRLYLSALKSGRKLTQLLVAQPHFDDAQVEILFCGDLDGDHIPDLIIDATNHYNMYQPVLYLSGKASTGELLKLVAKHTSVGC